MRPRSQPSRQEDPLRGRAQQPPLVSKPAESDPLSQWLLQYLLEPIQHMFARGGQSSVGTWALALAICMYLGMITVPLEMLPQNRYYNLLAQSFLAGRVDLPVTPLPELLALSDPYDPALNGPYRLHDAALYNGKYYLYHGPVPAVLAFAPAKLLGIELSQTTAAWLFLCGGFFAAIWSLHTILRTVAPGSPSWLMLAGVAALGLSNAGPFLLVRPDVYEVAIACGYCLGSTALALALAGVFGKSPAAGRLLALASLSAGLAVGARPNYIVLGPILLAAAWWHASAQGQPPFALRFIRSICGILAPFGSCILAIMAYNYARFGSPLEFGNRYQLPAIHPRDYPLFRLDTYFERLWRYCWFPPLTDAQFPYLHLPRGTYFGEPEAGAVWMAPLIIFTALWLVVWPFRRSAASFGVGPLRLIVIFGTGVLMLLLLPVLASPVIRYLVDFLGFLLLSSFFVWSQVRTRLMPQPGLRMAFDALCLLLVAWGCWVGVAFGTNGTPPSAIRHFYSARKLVDQGRPSEALEELSASLTVAPDFYLARSLRARLMASQSGGNAAAVAPEFTRAMVDYITQTAASQNRGYMPAFQGLIIADPLAEYALVARPLLERGETEAALATLRGMANAFVAKGFRRQALGILNAVKDIAERSNLPDFARMVGEMIGPSASQSAPPPGP